MPRILIVEDEPRLRKDMVDFLGLRGFRAEAVATAAQMRRFLTQAPAPDIVILDVGLPDGNGFELAAEIREALKCGIIMLTALGDSDDRIRGFESGADIYLVKDSTLREIEAAIASLLRRVEVQTPSRDDAEAGDGWILDKATWLLTAPNQRSLKLTATEFALLTALCRHGGEVCSREQLVEMLARPNAHFDNRHLDSIVSRLRRKMVEQSGLQTPIKVVYGVGYVFTDPVMTR